MATVRKWLSPTLRLDVAFSGKAGASARLPHGIIGQSFASTAPRNGMLDDYPGEGEFTTTAQAEGAIEGEAAMYEVPNSHAVGFAFSRFDGAALPSALAGEALAAGAAGDASSSSLT